LAPLRTAALDKASVINWGITSVFALLALLYVAFHPYDREKPVRTFFFLPEHAEATAPVRLA
jgi:hypothetical protein